MYVYDLLFDILNVLTWIVADLAPNGLLFHAANAEMTR